MVRIRYKSGPLFLALYLKQCSSSLQRAYAGERDKNEVLPISVSLTRSGFPRIIPAHHRRLMLARDDRADRLVKCYLSWFSLAKLITLAKPVSKETFQSITTECLTLDSVRSVCGDLKDRFQSLQRKYLPWISRIPVNQGMVCLFGSQRGNHYQI